MDILYLIDRLEEIIKNSKQMPIGGHRLVDESKIWPLLDQMRISIPDEVRRAERVMREKERMLAQTNEEAERIVALARAEAAKLVSEHAISQAAESRAAMIRERAEREADMIRAGADDYAFEVLCRLEQEMKRALTVIENGIRTVQAERERRRAGSPVATESGDGAAKDGPRAS
jgi:cell division septum initiation protein DivIVA